MSEIPLYRGGLVTRFIYLCLISRPESNTEEKKRTMFISHQVFLSRFAEVDSPTNLSTYRLLLPIQRASCQICAGIDFCKTTFQNFV